nr:reverse transcriptase domain-containing protein [Tanacetum cinerariifolium]
MVTKLRNEITNFRQRPDESLFEAWERYKISINRCPNHNMLPVTQIDTFYNGLTLRHRDTINAAATGTYMKRRPEECYDLIENMTVHHNDWDTSAQRSELSSSITSSSDSEIVALKAKMAKINKNLMNPPLANLKTYMLREPIIKVVILTNLKQAPIPQLQVVTTIEFANYMKANDAILKNMQTNMTSLSNSNLELKNMFRQFMKMNTTSSLGSGTLPSNTITNPKEDLKGITSRSENAYQGPTIPTTSSSLPKVVECETEGTKDTVPPTNNRSTKDVQPLVVKVETPMPNSEPIVTPVAKPIVAPVSSPKPNQKLSIPDFLLEEVDAFLAIEDEPTSSGYYQTYLDPEGDILLLEAFLNDDPSPPPYQGNYLPEVRKELKICEAHSEKSSVDEPHVAELKELPPHLEYAFLEGDDKLPVIIAKDLSVEEKTALITILKSHKRAIAWKLSDIKELEECIALADLGTSINLMPLFVWKKLSLLELTPTRMTLELVNRSVAYTKILRFVFKDLAFCLRSTILSTSKILRVVSQTLRFVFKDHAFYLGSTAFCGKQFVAGPYKLITVLVQAVATTNDSLAILEQTTVKTPMNMSPENKALFQAEKETIHLILTGIGDEIYSTVDACQTAQEMWEAIERLQQGESLNIHDPEWSRFVTIVKQQHKLDEVSYHKLFDILNQYQKEVNELRAERLARNANPIALVATAQANQDPYYQTSKSHKPYAPSSKPLIPTRSYTSTRHKGKEIAKPITPPFETTSEEDNDPEQAQRDKDIQKNLALIAKENVGSLVVQQSRIQCFNCKEFGHFAKECKKPKRDKDSAYHKEKMLLCKQAEQGVPLQAEQYDWLADTDEEIDEQELEAHYSYMAKI